MAAIAKLKLIERPEHLVANPQQVEPESRPDDKTDPEPAAGLESDFALPEQRAPIPDAEPIASYIEGFRALQDAANAHARAEIVARHPELLKALAVLREKEARVLELTCWQGMTYEAAGAVLELSPKELLAWLRRLEIAPSVASPYREPGDDDPRVEALREATLPAARQRVATSYPELREPHISRP